MEPPAAALLPAAPTGGDELSSRSLFHLQVGPWALPCVLLFHPEDAPSLSAAADAVLGELQNHLLANAAPLLLHRDGPPPPLATGAVSCTGPLLQVELTAAVPQACYSVGGLRVAGFEVTARVSLRAGAQARTMAALGWKKSKAG
jgi:hypothetical protein